MRRTEGSKDSRTTLVNGYSVTCVILLCVLGLAFHLPTISFYRCVHLASYGVNWTEPWLAGWCLASVVCPSQFFILSFIMQRTEGSKDYEHDREKTRVCVRVGFNSQEPALLFGWRFFVSLCGLAAP
ncbi:hypothetical protein R3P38DRAFT_1513473 [Favolaschia claudopus]|uniref:Uncharacterized protein n=1 Tax=Favolaschia claudopus TaxID=2862362 RepID=A0AAW0AIT9_9AGAR